jgi:hypothetical protein
MQSLQQQPAPHILYACTHTFSLIALVAARAGANNELCASLKTAPLQIMTIRERERERAPPPLLFCWPTSGHSKKSLPTAIFQINFVLWFSSSPLKFVAATFTKQAKVYKHAIRGAPNGNLPDAND